MSERLVAGQIKDVAEALDSMRETMGKRAPPQVTIHVPEQPVNVRVPENVPPNIHLNFEAAQPTQVKFDVPQLPPPVVKVDAPIINIEPPQARSYDVVVTERDAAGFIKSFKITPA